MAHQHIYDCCIIGGGISGLYFSKLLKERDPDASCILLEKQPRLGGRAQRSDFAGVKIVHGPAVARVGKDRRLMKLARDTDTKISIFEKHIGYSPCFGMNDVQAVNCIRHDIETLSSVSNLHSVKKGETFEQYAMRILGRSKYTTFSRLLGYTDYINANVSDTILDYGLEDNFSDHKNGTTEIAMLEWDVIVKRLTEMFHANFGKKNIKKRAYVRHISVIKSQSGRDDTYVVKYSTDFTSKEKGNQKKSLNEIRCRKVVCATTVDACRTIFPGQRWHSNLAMQPFIRIYGKIDKASSREFSDAVQFYTVVPNTLQKIIPIDKEAGVYMLAYADNRCADRLKKMGFGTKYENSVLLKQKMKKLLAEALSLSQDSLKIEKIKSFYWKGGTHYFRPYDKRECQGMNGVNCRIRDLQDSVQPSHGLFVIGEGFSRNQGWTEGALHRAEIAVMHMFHAH